MPKEVDLSYSPGIGKAGNSHQSLEALQRQFEAIRREHLARNQPRLKEFASEQRRYIELLTIAIIGKIFGAVANQWQASVAEGRATQFSEVLSLIWGLPTWRESRSEELLSVRNAESMKPEKKPTVS